MDEGDQQALGQYWSGAKEVDWSTYDGIRPAYPQEIFDTIKAYHAKHNRGGHQCAVDVGTGPGTLIPFLAKNFDKTIGTDLLQAQLDVAAKRFPTANVSFRQSSAEQLAFLNDGSVDMITCGETIHWLDSEAFFREAARVMRPGATIAVLFYHAYFTLPEHKEANEVLGALQDALLSPIVESKDEQMVRMCTNAATNLDCHKLERFFGDEVRIKWNPLPEKFAEWGKNCTLVDNKSDDCQEDVRTDKHFFSAMYDVDEIKRHLLSLGHTSVMLSNDEAVRNLFDETFDTLHTLLKTKTLASWSFTLLLGSRIY